VKDARDSRGDKPRTTDEAVDNDLTGRETGVVVVGFTVRKLVAWVVRNVPSDAVIQPNKDKGETGGPSGKNRNVSLSSKIKQIHQPRARAIGFLK
jgi:hypothetical protein